MRNQKRKHTRKNIVRGHVVKRHTESDSRRKDKVAEQIMRIQSEIRLFESLGYNPKTDTNKNKQFLSAAKADQILQNYFK